MPPTSAPQGGGASQIPRPADALPGRAAPWAVLPDAARRGRTLASLVAALRAAGRSLGSPVPDPLDELRDVPAPAAAGLHDSAVLIAAFEEGGEARIILTRRATTLKRHRGEVALPGGRLEHGEPPLDAALREAHEEVGLDPRGVTPVAWLRPIVTFASSSMIRPFVGTLSSRPSLRAQPDEVDRVFDVAVAELLEDGVFHEERWRRRSPRATEGDGRFPIAFFEVDGETIWGATARILTELCCLAVGLAPR